LPPLTEVKLRAIKPTGKIERFSDSGGLYLEVSKAGGKHWRWKYRFEKKEKRLSFGPWPETTLKEARERRDAARKLLRTGVDPGTRSKQVRAIGPAGEASATFEEVATEFIRNQRNVWAESHAKRVEGRLRLDVYPHIGHRPIASVTEPRDILVIIRKIEARKAFDCAHRVLGICSRVFRYGVTLGIVSSDPCRDLKGALVPYQKGQFAALTKPEEVGRLMLAIDNYKGTVVVRAALVFSALTFCRPCEVRRAEWREVDFNKNIWTVSKQTMKGTWKTRAEHHVPLSRQAIEVLEGIRPYSGTGKYIFPGTKKGRPLSENGVNGAIRNMGYTDEQMTAHGFRAMASTLLNELAYRHDVIEAQLAHKDSNQIRAIYNRAEYMAERRHLMQAWADYLDELRALATKGFSGS